MNADSDKPIYQSKAYGSSPSNGNCCFVFESNASQDCTKTFKDIIRLINRHVKKKIGYESTQNGSGRKLKVQISPKESQREELIQALILMSLTKEIDFIIYE